MHAITLPQGLSSSSGFSQVMGKPDGELFNMGGGQLTAKSTKIGKPVFHFSPAVLGFGVFLSQCCRSPQFGAYEEQHL